MQTLPISSQPNPTSPFQKSSKIKPIVSSKLSSCPSKNPRLQRKNLLHFPFNQPIPPNFNKKTQSLSLSLSKSKSLLHLLLNDPFAKINKFQQTCFIFKKLELIKTLKLPLSFWDHNDMKRALKIFARSFQKAHYLTNLDLHFGYNVRLAPILTRKLSSLFQTMQSLKNLSILYPKNNYTLGNLILSPLLSGIQKLRSLTHLCIKFYQASIDEDQIQLLYSGLLQCRSLTHLELDLHLCPNLTNEGIRKLLIAGRNLKIASFELRLNVSADPIKEAIFYKDLESIMEFEVQDFSTSNRYSGVSQNSTFKFFYKDLSEPEKLRHFYVRFHQTQDPKQRREYNIQRDLILALPNLQDIKSLNLTCLGYYGNEKLSQNLAARFLQMKTLEKLALEFNYSSVHLPDLSGIIKALGSLKHIPNLQFLELKFSGFDISASQIKSLFGSCLLKINPLKALELDLGESKISPTIFENLALLNLCGNLHQLESLRLTLSLTVEKEDHGKLAGLIKGVFSRKQKIELEEFCHALKNLKALKYLDVKFENVHFASEDQKALSKSLMEMKSLQKIKIESSYDEKLKGKIRGFEDLFIKKAWLTLSVQFHSTKSERIALTPVLFTFEDYGHMPHHLEISFCHYDDAPWHRHYPRFFKNLLEFFKESSPNFIENNSESHKSLSQILRDSKKTAFLDLTAPADKSLDILKAFAQKFSINDLKFAKYSFTINSK